MLIPRPIVRIHCFGRRLHHRNPPCVAVCGQCYPRLSAAPGDSVTGDVDFSCTRVCFDTRNYSDWDGDIVVE